MYIWWNKVDAAAYLAVAAYNIRQINGLFTIPEVRRYCSYDGQE
jgi:hypothetical protein